MGRIRGHLHLRLDRPLFSAREGLTLGGRTFRLNEHVPWQTLPGVGPRVVRLLHEQKRLRHLDGDGGITWGAEDVQDPDVADRVERARASAQPSPVRVERRDVVEMVDGRPEVIIAERLPDGQVRTRVVPAGPPQPVVVGEEITPVYPPTRGGKRAQRAARAAQRDVAGAEAIRNNRDKG